MPVPVNGDECSDSKNSIDRPAKAGLSGSRILAEAEKGSASTNGEIIHFLTDCAKAATF